MANKYDCSLLTSKGYASRAVKDVIRQFTGERRGGYIRFLCSMTRMHTLNDLSDSTGRNGARGKRAVQGH